jgi:hypothetical protein
MRMKGVMAEVGWGGMGVLNLPTDIYTCYCNWNCVKDTWNSD